MTGSTTSVIVFCSIDSKWNTRLTKTKLGKVRKDTENQSELA